MRHQRAFDLEGRDVDAAHLQHVVGAAAIGVIAVARRGYICRRCASTRPRKVSTASARGCSSNRRRWSGPRSAARRSRRPSPAALLVDQADVVARHRHAGRAVTHLRPAGWRRRCAASRSSRCRRGSRRRGARSSACRHPRARPRRRRRSAATPISSRLRQIGAREHRGIERRHAIEDRRLLFLQHARHRSSASAVRPCRIAGRPDRQREGQPVAEAVGEEQLGRGEHRVAFARCRGSAWRRARRSDVRCDWRCTAPLGAPVEPEE